MKTILTCTDGSSYSPEIYKHAAWAAKRLHAPIELLHVVEHHREHAEVVDLSGAIGMDASEDLTEELTRLEEIESRSARIKGKAMLQEAVHFLEAHGISEVAVTQRHGSFLETLNEADERAQLLVIGKKGEHAEARGGALGEHFENALRMSSCPVLVPAREFRPISKFLIAYDDSPSARRAVDHAMTSPLLHGLPCLLLMVGHADAAHQQALEQAVLKLNQAGFHAEAKSVGGHPAQAIPVEAQRWQADLLVMGAYGHSRLREFFLGSVTTKLVQASSTAVLMFH
ncbi:MAG: universal stress protein [Verrucomicrobiales bacterium]